MHVETLLITNEEDEGARASFNRYLEEKKHTRGILGSRWIAGFISAACLIMVVTGGIAAMKMYELKSTTGAVTYSVEKVDGTWKEWNSNNSLSVIPNYYKFYETLEKIRMNLEPGTAVAVYGKEQDYSFTVYKPMAVANFGDFLDKVKPYFDLPKILANGYEFKESFLDYRTEKGLQYLDEMRREAIQTNQSIVIKPLKVFETMFLEEIKVIYEGDQGMVELKGLIFRAGGGAIQDIAPEDALIEQVKLKGEEAIYTLRTDEERTAQQVTWIENINNGKMNVNIFYTLTTESKEITKSSFLEIANRLR